MARNQIPASVGALIDQTWLDGVIQEFDLAESGFNEIRGKVEFDLSRIRGASLYWQTNPNEPVFANDDATGEQVELPFQSYHVFFLVPDGDDCRYATETDDLSNQGAVVSGEGRIGCAAAVSLANAVAIVDFADRSLYEDGTSSGPEINMSITDQETGEPIAAEDFYAGQVSPEAIQRLEELRARIAEVLQNHGLEIWDRAVLDTPVDGLAAGEGVYMAEPIRVCDAFFYRGV